MVVSARTKSVGHFEYEDKAKHSNQLGYIIDPIVSGEQHASAFIASDYFLLSRLKLTYRVRILNH